MRQRVHNALILVCAALLSGGVAHASSVIVGLCDGDIGVDGKSKPGGGMISAGCIIPAEMLSDYAGMSITKMRIALGATEGYSNCHGWIKGSFETDELTSTAIIEPREGWNEISLTQPLSITSGQDYAIGYSFEQDKSCKVILVAGQDEDDDYIPAFNGIWIAKDGVWSNYSEKDGYDGSLCVEIVIEDSRLPAKNISLHADSIRRAVSIGDALTAKIVAKNIGEEKITGLTYRYRINDLEERTLTTDLILNTRDKDTLNISLPTGVEMIGKCNKLFITATSEGCQKELECEFTVYDENYQYPHYLLVEKFSTERCPNCKRAIETFEAMEEEGYSAYYNHITHHCGYTSDFLTVPEDKEYTWLYGNSGSYAPAGMLDRRYDETYPRNVTMPVPVIQIGYPDDWRPILERAIAEPAFVEVTPKAVYDPESREMNVSVEMEKSDVLDYLNRDTRLTVILIEDNVLHHSQAGYGNPNFRHRHVYRKTLSAIWGDEIEWEDNRAVKTYSMTIPEVWTDHEFTEKNANGEDWLDTCDDKELEVIAFINEYNPQKRSACRVYNSGKCKVEHESSGIALYPEETKSVKTEYYDISGRQISTPSQGLYLKIKTYANGKKEVTKIIE